MWKMKLTVLLIALLVPAPMPRDSQGRHSREIERRPAARTDLALVMVSSVTLDPKEIHQSSAPSQAVVTVQIFHLTVTTAQTVSLNLGTFSTDPLSGVTVSYTPASQTVRIPSAPTGVVVARAKVWRPDIGANASAKLVVAATLTNPSSGIRVEDSPSLGDWQATLEVRKP